MSTSPVVNEHHPDLQRWRLPWPPEDQPRRLSHWTIHGAYVSSIACALHLTAKQDQDPDADAREELRRVMNMFRMRAYDLGYLMPVIAFIGAEAAHLKELQAWAADSEWTGGRFILIVAKRTTDSAASDRDLMLELLRDFLSPRDETSDLKLELPVSFADALDGVQLPDGPTNELMTRLVKHALRIDSDPNILSEVLAEWRSSFETPSRELLDDFTTGR